MRAVRYLGPEQNFELRTVPLPVVKSGHVLIEVKAASLCHTELHFANGTLSGVHDTTMGHECSGIIVSVGEDVLQSRIGERVIVYYYSGCGCCQHCNNGDEQLCSSLKAQYGFQSDGGLAQFITVYSRNAILLPEKISFQEAAPIGCGVTTAVHALELAELKIDEWVAIFGVNGVGFNIIQLAKHFGAKVIAICRSDVKRIKAVQLGVDAVVDATDISTVSDSVRQITGGNGANIIFECVGNKDTINQCIGSTGCLSKRGRLVFIGYEKGIENSMLVHPVQLIINEQKILGSVGATLQNLKDAIRYVETGVITIVVDSCIPISEFQIGLDRLKACKCIGKIVIDDFSK